MDHINQEPLKGTARVQHDVLGSLVDDRVITAKEVAQATGHSHAHAYNYIQGLTPLRLDGLNDLLRGLPRLTTAARQQIAGIALHGTGIIAVDLAYPEHTGNPTMVAIVRALEKCTAAADQCLAAEADTLIEQREADAITDHLDLAIGDLVRAKQAIQQSVQIRKPARRPAKRSQH